MNRIVNRALGMLLLAGLLAGTTSAVADEREELLLLRNTMVGMIEQLVEQGVITEAQAATMIEKAETEAAEEARKVAQSAAADPSAVRVTYVPEIVKDEIREQVMNGLRREVVDEVLATAQSESWGVPGALPAWINDINWNMDLRVRGQANIYDKGNQENFYLNFQDVNDAGGIGLAGQDALLNVSENEDTMRVRMRFGADVRLTNAWHMGMRVSTGSENNPVSRNSVLGTEGVSAVVDRAYIHYRSKYFLFSGGRIPNPFISTSLVWDEDLSFDGVSVTGVLPFGAANRAFLTAGAFPIEPVELSSDDKWLIGTQMGVQFGFNDGGHVGISASYYDFQNIEGTRNEPESQLLDYTAPRFLQKGNTLFDIRNDIDPDTNLFALAGDYDIIEGLLLFDSGPTFRIGSSRPVHLVFSADYVKNIGWDTDEVAVRTGVANIDERTEGYRLRFDVGQRTMERWGDFRIGAIFRHAERDALLDAFTDSDFHLGGTDNEGWGLEFQLGLARNTWMEVQYLTASEIDGPPLGIDVLFLDLNARF